MDLSVIVPTYGRPEPVVRLLGELAEQTLPPDRYEVIIVDDGSPEPIAPRLRSVPAPHSLRVLTQRNGGPGAARQAGVAQAKGDVLVFLDDDMAVGPGFLEAHAREHERMPRAAVQGRIVSPPDIDERPPFERYHAQRLARSFAELAAGRTKLRGQNLCSGNLSVRRFVFEEVGGFDTTLPRSEDAELGLRLERASVSLVYSDAASAAHCSGPESVEGWLEGAFRYGACERKVSEKHPWAAHADPFRYVFLLGPARGTLLAACALAPGAARPVPAALVAAGEALDRAGLRSAAVHLTGLAYGTQLFRGLG
ncbi:MAG: glycosyltransferase family 2 protein, partial [Myxococcales bacterium]